MGIHDSLTATRRNGRDGEVVIELAGELDLATAPIVREALQAIPLARGCSLVFDLTGVSFADSAGISSLVMACKGVRSEDGTFSMTGCQHEVRRVLEICGLIEYLDVR